MDAYTKTDWTNNQEPAINMANLNKIEAQLELLTNKFIQQETSITTQKVIADEYDLHTDGNKGMWYEEDSEVASTNSVELATKEVSTKETLQFEDNITAEEVTEKGEVEDEEM